MIANGWIAHVFNCLFVAFVTVPLLIVVLVAFTASDYLALPTDGLSLRWFAELMQDRDFIQSFFLSLALSTLAASAALVLALPAALACSRTHFFGKALLLVLFQSPLMVPAVVLGIAFLRFLSTIGWSGTLSGLLVCHIVIVMPYILRLSLAAFADFDQRCEAAAISLGASRFTTFRRITLPLVMPGVVAGWVLAFITSFDDLTVSVFVSGPGAMPLSVRLFNRMTETVDPLVAAVSSVLIFMAILALVLLDRSYGVDRVFASRVRE